MSNLQGTGINGDSPEQPPHKGSINPSNETITGVVLEGEVIDPKPAEPQKASKATVTTLAPRNADDQQFGLVPLHNLTPALAKVVSSGDTRHIASEMMADQELIKDLAQTSPFQIYGTDAENQVRGAIKSLHMLTNKQAALEAAGSLSWGIRDMFEFGQNNDDLRLKKHLASIANMMLSAVTRTGGDAAVQQSFVEQLQELIKSGDESLADALGELLAANPGSTDGVLRTFERIMSYAAAFQNDLAALNEEDRQEGGKALMLSAPVLFGSLALRAVTFALNRDSSGLVRATAAHQYAKELKIELVQPEEKGIPLIFLMAKCEGIAYDFFKAMLGSGLDEMKPQSQTKTQAAPFAAAKNTLAPDALECLLGAGCMLWPDKFYAELDQRYEIAPPAAKQLLLNAMKFAVRDREEREDQLVARALILFVDNPANTRGKVVPILKDCGEQLLNRLTEDNARLYSSLSAEVRHLLMCDVFAPLAQSDRALPSSREQIANLLLADVATGDLAALSITALRDILSDETIAALPNESTKDLRWVLLKNLKRFEDPVSAAEVNRIVSRGGFAAITESFDFAQKYQDLEPELSRKVLRLSAQIASEWQAPRDLEKALICRFTLEHVLPPLAKKMQATAGAAKSASNKANDREDTQRQLNHLHDRIEKERALIELIRSHPGVNNASGIGAPLVRTVGGKEIEGKSKLDDLAERIEKAKIVRDAETEQALTKEREELLNLTFGAVTKCPNWPEKLKTIPLKTLLQWNRSFNELLKTAEKLEVELAGYEGSESWFDPDTGQKYPLSEYPTLAEAQAAGAGPYSRFSSEEGITGQAEDAANSLSDAALEDAAILRMFLSSPCIDQPTAQLAYEALPPDDVCASLIRFNLSRRFRIEDSVAVKEARDESEDYYTLSEICRQELGVSLGDSPEVKKAKQSYNPEADFAAQVAARLPMQKLDGELRHILEGICAEVEGKRYLPLHPKLNPIYRLVAARFATSVKNGFDGDSQDAWGTSANQLALKFLWLAYHNQPEVKLRAQVDIDLRAALKGWLTRWEPPQEPNGLRSSSVLPVIGNYIEEPSSMARKFDLAILLARKVSDHVESLTPALARDLRGTVERVRNAFSEKELNQPFKYTMPGGDVFCSQLGTLFEVTLDALGKRLERLAPFSPSRAPGQQNMDLRLPWGRTEGGSLGLLPQYGTSQSRPALPQGPS